MSDISIYHLLLCNESILSISLSNESLLSNHLLLINSTSGARVRRVCTAQASLLPPPLEESPSLWPSPRVLGHAMGRVLACRKNHLRHDELQECDVHGLLVLVDEDGLAYEKC